MHAAEMSEADSGRPNTEKKIMALTSGLMEHCLRSRKHSGDDRSGWTGRTERCTKSAMCKLVHIRIADFRECLHTEHFGFVTHWIQCWLNHYNPFRISLRYGCCVCVCVCDLGWEIGTETSNHIPVLGIFRTRRTICARLSLIMSSTFDMLAMCRSIALQNDMNRTTKGPNIVHTFYISRFARNAKGHFMKKEYLVGSIAMRMCQTGLLAVLVREINLVKWTDGLTCHSNGVGWWLRYGLRYIFLDLAWVRIKVTRISHREYAVE